MLLSCVARIFSNMKNSPNEEVESPSRGYEPLSPRLSETSAHAERRPDRTFVWPLSRSELDMFWVSDEASVSSPGSAQGLVLHSPMSETFESPRRSPNNESDASYGYGLKSVGRSERGGMVNAQRGDTETTISIFDTALSEALGSADTADDTWLFESSDDPRPNSQYDDESDEDRSTKHESSAEEDDVIAVRKEDHTKEARLEYNNSCTNTHRSWQQDKGKQNDDRAADTGPCDSVLTPDKVKVLTKGICIESVSSACR